MDIVAQTTSSQIMTVLVLIGAVTGGCNRSIDILPAVPSGAETAAATIESTERVCR
jgi:uncharacterized NAD(P)/FAD-binding protein YdhS